MKNLLRWFRNLKSHKTFEKLGYAEEIEGGFRILPAGANFLEQNGFVLIYLYKSKHN